MKENVLTIYNNGDADGDGISHFDHQNIPVDAQLKMKTYQRKLPKANSLETHRIEISFINNFRKIRVGPLYKYTKDLFRIKGKGECHESIIFICLIINM